MKKFLGISGVILTAAVVFMGCGRGDADPGRVYMPDMAYSSTIESYAMRDSNKFTSNVNNKGSLIYFNGAPVAGTIKRGGELYQYTLSNDSAGYAQSAAVKNPIGEVSKANMDEAARLFNINCAVCHDAKGTGQGPLAAKVPGVANLTGDVYKLMADGTMFHSIAYGKNNMGAYASQLNRKQRWMMIKYIRTLQSGTTAAVKADSTKTATAPAAKDSAAKK